MFRDAGAAPCLPERIRSAWFARSTRKVNHMPDCNTQPSNPRRATATSLAASAGWQLVRQSAAGAARRTRRRVRSSRGSRSGRPAMVTLSRACAAARPEKPQVSAPESPLKQLPGDHHALDLVGALVDLGDLGIAHHALDWVVVDVAVPAEQLYRVGGDRHRHV